MEYITMALPYCVVYWTLDLTSWYKPSIPSR